MLCDLLQEHGTRLLRPELRLDIAFLNNPKSSFGVKCMTFTKGREANQNFRVTDDGKVAAGFSRKNTRPVCPNGLTSGRQLLRSH